MRNEKEVCDCNIKLFKSYNELPENCTIRNGLLETIQTQIIETAIIIKSTHTEDEFKNYCQDEIQKANSSIKALIDQFNKNKRENITDYNHSINSALIWNIERKKALNQLLVVEKNESLSTKVVNSEIENEFKILLKNDNISKNDYDSLVSCFTEFFDNGSFPTLNSKIVFKGISNVDIGITLKNLISISGQKINNELLLFIKNHIKNFENVRLDLDNKRNCNVYKTLTKQKI